MLFLRRENEEGRGQYNLQLNFDLSRRLQQSILGKIIDKSDFNLLRINICVYYEKYKLIREDFYLIFNDSKCVHIVRILYVLLLLVLLSLNSFYKSSLGCLSFRMLFTVINQKILKIILFSTITDLITTAIIKTKMVVTAIIINLLTNVCYLTSYTFTITLRYYFLYDYLKDAISKG